MRAVCLPDKWSATISLTLSEPQPQHGTVQLNAERGASDELISCDVNRADFLKAVSDVLGVVVIDPEDRVQVERIVAAVTHAQDWTPYDDPASDQTIITKTQAALREFANPKPKEPTGLGAVVEDEKGRLWVNLTDPKCSTHTDPWVSVHDPDRWASYSDIAVVKVLSGGAA